MLRPLLFLVLLPLAGCTATLATIRLLEADRAVHAAAEVGAATEAPYEYTLAERHRSEAWDASNHAQYKVAVDLCRTSVTWAEQAKLVATGGTRDVRQVGEDHTDEATTRPPTPDAPSAPPASRPPSDLDDEDFLDENEESPR